MKSKIRNYTIFLSLFLTLTSCLNKYEKDVIGSYELYKYELVNTKIETYEFTKLNINDDKTFEIKLENKIIKGNWLADDNGDWTYIVLEFNGEKYEGRILGNSITLIGKTFKEFKNLKSIEFTKTE